MKQTISIAVLILTIGLLSLMYACKKKDFLSGYDKNALFAAPSVTEGENVFNTWQQRDLTPTNYSIVEQVSILGGKFAFKIVSYKIAGIKEYGALLIPKTNGTVPVRMLIGGFGLDVTTNSHALIFDSLSSGPSCILAIPAMRGQSLEITLNGIVHTSPLSEGVHCDAFDGATDDVIAFLNLIQQTESTADVNRTAIRGGSRGCTVALLAGIRDKRVKRVVGVAGPTDFLKLTAQNENDPTYQCQFLSALKNNQSTFVETRNKLIASSPLYFAQHLPLTQLHMALNDTHVPMDQGYQLQQKMSELGMGSNFEIYTYNRTHEDIATNNPEMADRIEQFLSQL